jgi:hypothetical protein
MFLTWMLVDWRSEFVFLPLQPGRFRLECGRSSLGEGRDGNRREVRQFRQGRDECANFLMEETPDGSASLASLDGCNLCFEAEVYGAE